VPVPLSPLASDPLYTPRDDRKTSGRLHRRQWLTWTSALAVSALNLPAQAKSAPPDPVAIARPSGEVLLSISGQVERRNTADGVDFDMAMLTALPQWTLETTTPWSPERHRFTGPLLRTLLEYCGARGTSLHALALNDYDVNIPVSDAYEGDVIIARLKDGQPMRVRDRGPLFIIYPFDQNARWRRPTVISRAIWQLRRIEVR
jgi:hypothetical protein